jgi:hypothetical protein
MQFQIKLQPLPFPARGALKINPSSMEKQQFAFGVENKLRNLACQFAVRNLYNEYVDDCHGLSSAKGVTRGGPASASPSHANRVLLVV